METMAKNIKAIVSMLVFSTSHGEGKQVHRRRNKQTKRTSPLQFTIDVFDEYLNISFSSCRLQNNEEFPWKCTIMKTAQDLNVMLLAVFSLIFLFFLQLLHFPNWMEEELDSGVENPLKVFNGEKIAQFHSIPFHIEATDKQVPLK